MEQLQFETFSDFLAMGGHGPYVWAVYAITVVVLVGLLLAPAFKIRRLHREQQARARREQAASGRSTP